jgi:hypothetical protein
MCAAGADGAELWWSSNRTKTLSAFDLFLQSRRAVDAPNFVDRGPSKNTPPSLFCAGACFGEVTAIAAEESSALLWTGTDAGEVGAWDTDVACQWGGAAAMGAPGKSAAVTAIAPVASGRRVGSARGRYARGGAAAAQAGGRRHRREGRLQGGRAAEAKRRRRVGARRRRRRRRRRLERRARRAQSDGDGARAPASRASRLGFHGRWRVGGVGRGRGDVRGSRAAPRPRALRGRRRARQRRPSRDVPRVRRGAAMVRDARRTRFAFGRRRGSARDARGDARGP